jgi:hypothetical protein
MRYILYLYLTNRISVLFYCLAIGLDKAFKNYILILIKSNSYNITVLKITLLKN